ncbi:MAG: YcxB family protein [Bacillota bacterium]|nr:YcxB family protein [Bacillota bacterium]
MVVNITPDDCWNFTKYNIKYDSKSKLKFYLNVIAVISLIAFTSFLDKEPIRKIMPTIILSIPMSYYLMLFLMKQQIKNRVKGNEGIIGEHTIEICEDGLREITKVNNSLYLWSGISKIKQDNSYVYIYVEKYTAHVIPKNSFKSEDEAIQFFSDALKYWKGET